MTNPRNDAVVVSRPLQFCDREPRVSRGLRDVRALGEPDAGVQTDRAQSVLERPPALIVAVIIELERSPLVTLRLCDGRKLGWGEMAFLEPVSEPPRYPEPGKGTEGGRASNAATRELRFAIFAC